MKKLCNLLVFLSLIGSFSCQEDDSANEPLSPISLAGYPRQSGVDLQINNKVFYPGVSSWAPVPVNLPDSYDLFISTDQGAEFQRAATVFTEGYRLSLENLIDGTPYYITARANKKGQLSVQSDTIMVVPSSLKQITNGDWRFDEAERISLSPTTDSAAFITRRINSTLLNTSDLYIFPYFTNEPKRIERNVAECRWSPSGKLIAFTKRVDADNASAKDLQLSVYDIASDSIINLPVVSTSLSSLAFSPDSEWIYYVDNDANNTDLVWRIKADGTLREAVIGRQTPGLENSASFVVGKFSIHPNGSDLFFSGAQLSTSPIYKYSSVSGIAEVVFDDRWPSYVPTLSPDGQKLAFLSDRSGRREIWTYEVLKGSFQQVTGFEQRGWYDIDIQWVTDSEMAVGNLRIHL